MKSTLAFATDFIKMVKYLLHTFLNDLLNPNIDSLRLQSANIATD